MRMILVATLALAPLLAKDNDPAKRLNEAAAVFCEVMATPDKGIPQDMLANAHCIVIVPGLKTAAFRGRRQVSERATCPAAARPARAGRRRARSASRAAASAFRSAARTTDLIMLVMNERGADKLLSSKFTLGAEGSVAAGPVGRTATAQTDAPDARRDSLLVAVAGTVRRPRAGRSHPAPGSGRQRQLSTARSWRTGEIVTTSVRTPKAAARLIALLNKYSARERGTKQPAPANNLAGKKNT